MKIEYRVTWIDTLGSKQIPPVDIISIGSESCLFPLLTQNLIKAMADIKSKGVTLKLVTPRVRQHNIHRVIDLLQSIQREGIPLEIVVNDWGLFYYCSQITNIFHIHIGRQLCRSLLDCPWNKEILSNETEFVGQAISGHPYSDQDRWEYLSHSGVIGIEINAAGSDIQAFKRLEKHGLHVALHDNEYLLSCGSVCLAKRLEPSMPCQELCGKRFLAEPLGKWHNSFDNKVHFTPYEQSLLQGMQIQGKKVLLPQKVSPETLYYIDTLIIGNENKIIDRRMA